jgi:hypothetical protein
MKDFKGIEYAAQDLKGKLAVTDKGQTVDITLVRGEDVQVAYPNGRRGWEPLSDLTVLNY